MKIHRHLTIALTALTGAAAVVLPATPVYAAMETATGGVSLTNGTCIDLPYGSTADGTRPQLWTCDGGDAQKWTFRNDDATIRIADKCLDVAGGIAAEGAAVQIANCNGSNAQKWDWPFDDSVTTTNLKSRLGSYYLAPDTTSTPPKLKISTATTTVWFPPTSYKYSLQGNLNHTRWVGDDPATDSWSYAHNITWPTDSTRGVQVAALNGTSSYASVLGRNVDTDDSFTVSIWAKLNTASPGRNVTAVSEDGSYVSSFYLGYDSSTSKWAFKRMNADVNNASGVDALSTSNATTGWTHLTGVYNDYSDTISLYVNGTHQNTQSFTNTFPSPHLTDFKLGRAKWNDTDVDFFPGRLSSFRSWSYALNAWEINEVYVNG